MKTIFFFTHDQRAPLHPYARPAAARNGKATAAAAHRVLRLPGPTQERDITLTPTKTETADAFSDADPAYPKPKGGQGSPLQGGGPHLGTAGSTL